MEEIYESFRPVVKSYFVRCHETIEYIDETTNIIQVKGFNESFANIIHKTKSAMSILIEKHSSLDYILRTNISSFVHIPRLLACLDTFPTKGLYAGTHYYNIWDSPIIGKHHHFISGDSILMSKDVYSLILNTDIDAIKDHNADDVIIGHIMELNNITIKDWVKQYVHRDHVGTTNKDVYQFRCKTENDRSQDSILQQRLYDMYYA